MTKQKWLVLVLALVMVAAVSTAASADSIMDTIQRRGSVRIGTAPGYLPFEMLDVDGNFMGYDIDLGNALGAAMGVDVQFVQFPFAGLIAALQTGEIDMIIAGMTIRGDRALAASFSNPYYATGQVLMLPANDTTTQSWEDLDQRGYRIAVSQGTTGALLAKELYQNADVLDFDDFPTSAMALTQGMADAIVYDEPAVRMYELMQPGAVRGLYDLISSENLGIAVPHNDFAAVQWINSFLYSYVGSVAEQASKIKWFQSTDWMDLME